MKSRQASKKASLVRRLNARRRLWLAAEVTAVLGLWLALSPAADAKKPPPPAKRTYFFILLGVEGSYESSAACMTFKKKRLCSLDGEVCGSWEHSEGKGKELGFRYQITFTEEATPIVINGSARVDDRLKKSSLGGAATITIEGRVGNVALVGREVRAGRCGTLAEAFNARAASGE
jgi:hypothetical protein